MQGKRVKRSRASGRVLKLRLHSEKLRIKQKRIIRLRKQADYLSDAELAAKLEKIAFLIQNGQLKR